MKFLLVTLAVIAAVSADVSHLDRTRQADGYHYNQPSESHHHHQGAVPQVQQEYLPPGQSQGFSTGGAQFQGFRPSGAVAPVASFGQQFQGLRPSGAVVPVASFGQQASFSQGQFPSFPVVEAGSAPLSQQSFVSSASRFGGVASTFQPSPISVQQEYLPPNQQYSGAASAYQGPVAQQFLPGPAVQQFGAGPSAQQFGAGPSAQQFGAGPSAQQFSAVPAVRFSGASGVQQHHAAQQFSSFPAVQQHNVPAGPVQPAAPLQYSAPIVQQRAQGPVFNTLANEPAPAHSLGADGYKYKNPLL